LIHSSFVECILLLRTWAIWNRNKSLGIGLVALLLAFIVLQFVLGNDFVNSMEYASPPYPGFRGCLVTNADRILWGTQATVMVVDAVVFVLIVISAYLSYQRGNIGKFSFIIYKDGIMFYVYMFFVVAASMAATIALPLDMILLFSPLQYMLQSILASRIVLNIRGAGNRSRETELHTCYSDPSPIAIPLHTLCMEDLASCDSIR